MSGRCLDLVWKVSACCKEGSGEYKESLLKTGSSQDRCSQDWLSQVRSSQDRSSQDRSSQARSSQDSWSQDRSS